MLFAILTVARLLEVAIEIPTVYYHLDLSEYI